MDWLKKLGGRLPTGSGRDTNARWIYVQCDRCGEKLHTRVDLSNDLSLEFDESGRLSGYFCRKTIIGSSRCFEPIKLELRFDPSRQLVDKQIDGGQFITKTEHESGSD